jgi:hypothetical protein
MKRLGIAALAGLWLILTAGACATTGQPGIRVVSVKLPTPVSCIPEDYQAAPPSAVTRQALLAAQDAAARYQLLAEFWAAETPDLALQRQLIEACRTAAAAR